MGDCLKKAGCRIFQAVEGAVVKVTPYPKQEVICGNKTLKNAAGILRKREVKSVFITCSRSVHRNGLMDEMLDELEKAGIRYVIFEDINANPTVGNVDEGYQLYCENDCEAIITVGGGSPMDCAKIIGIKVTNPKLSYADMRSMLKIRHRMPFMIAVPTTAGTGSESTIAAVISDPANRDKYVVLSPMLMPHCVILDPWLTVGLSSSFTAYTGMDALTHAIEAYIGTIDTKASSMQALEAIRLTFENLETAFNEPSNIEARENMLKASNLAGVAFTRVFIGYVHAFSHAMSALYNVGHGKTNAIILPYILEYYGKTIYKKMARIARYIGVDKEMEINGALDDEALCKLLIIKIKELNIRLDIPTHVEEIRKEDIHILVSKALHEGNPKYPVPKIMNYEEGVELFEKKISP